MGRQKPPSKGTRRNCAVAGCFCHILVEYVLVSIEQMPSQAEQLHDAAPVNRSHGYGILTNGNCSSCVLVSSAQRCLISMAA